VKAAVNEAASPHDWQGMTAKISGAAKRGTVHDDQPDTDPENAGIRTEPELPIHEDIAPPSKQVAKEFDFEHDEQTDDDVARNRRLQERMRGNARRASLDPSDGIEL
ncbi:MAG: conjugal transfer protein TraG, partial [Betaproteobacteria bacterium]|nr:conjugal transfer protein TraG [Betaproteobacteria bacterium]